MPRLDEFNADEWFDVARKFKPRLTRAEFDQSWAEFQRDKEEHQRKLKRQPPYPYKGECDDGFWSC